jgi:hypothetical protein
METKDGPPDLALDLILLLARQIYRLVIAVGNQSHLITEAVALDRISTQKPRLLSVSNEP